MNTKQHGFSLGILAVCALNLAMATAGSSQTSLGSIQGIVVGEDGYPIANAKVFAGIPAIPAPVQAPPTMIARLGNYAFAAKDGSFSIKSLAPGKYILCAQTTISGWLDPCHWSASVPALTLGGGENLAGQRIVLARGAVIKVRINDPQGLLAPTTARTPAADIDVQAQGSNNGFYSFSITHSDSTGRDHELTVPFGQTYRVMVSSNRFSLADAKGAVFAAGTSAQPVQTANGTAPTQLVFTVNGRR